jgi:two-component system NtrC family response regulator
MAKVLIIDDENMMNDALAQTLEPMAHRTVSESTLKDGPQGVASNDFDVVFLDVRMPDGNRLNALPKIRGHHH